MTKREFLDTVFALAPFGRDLSSYDGGNPVVTAWMPLSEPYQKGEQDDR